MFATTWDRKWSWSRDVDGSLISHLKMMKGGRNSLCETYVRHPQASATWMCPKELLIYRNKTNLDFTNDSLISCLSTLSNTYYIYVALAPSLYSKVFAY